MLYKQLNLNQLIVPSGIGLHEHFCRRWLSIRLLRHFPEPADGRPVAGAQLSEFVHTRERFLCLGFSRPLTLSRSAKSSVIIGFRVDAELYNAIRFASDPAIPKVYIHETCERCPLTPEQCADRAAPPAILRAEEAATARRLAVNRLRESVS